MSKDKDDPKQRYESLLFQSPDRWETVRVREVGHVQLGRQKSPGNRSDKYPTPYVRAGNITWQGLNLEDTLEMEFTPSERETFELHPGDVLLSEASGSPSEVGKPAIWPSGMELHCFQNTVVRFRSNVLIPRYSLHLFTAYAQRGIFAAQSRGVGIHHLSATRFAQLLIPVPPAAEQEQIADRIEELFADLDAGVSALRRVQKKLKRYRAALLHAAVTGRLTADWRAKHGDGGESGTELLDRILKARREDWEQRTLADYEAKSRKPPKNWRSRYRDPEEPETHGLAELPAGWIWTTLDQISHVTGGVAKNRKAESASDRSEIAYLRVANVQRGYLDLTQIKTIRATEADIQDLKLRHGDVLMTEGGDRDKLGRGWIWEDQLENCIHQNHVFRARLLVSECESRLVSHAANGYGREWFMKNGKQSVNLASISLGQLRRFPFPLAPVAEQCEIADAISEKVSSIDAMETEVDRGLRRAARLRQAILKAAFEGKLVPQNPDDEPASELLARIQAEADAEAAAAPKRTPRKRKAAKKKSTKAKASS